MLHAENGKWRRVGRSRNQQQCGHSRHSISLQGMPWAPQAQGIKSPKERATGSLEKLDLALDVFLLIILLWDEAHSVQRGSNAHEGSCHKAAGATRFSPNISWQRSIHPAATPFLTPKTLLGYLLSTTHHLTQPLTGTE